MGALLWKEWGAVDRLQPTWGPRCRLDRGLVRRNRVESSSEWAVRRRDWPRREVSGHCHRAQAYDWTSGSCIRLGGCGFWKNRGGARRGGNSRAAAVRTRALPPTIHVASTGGLPPSADLRQSQAPPPLLASPLPFIPRGPRLLIGAAPRPRHIPASSFPLT